MSESVKKKKSKKKWLIVLGVFVVLGGCTALQIMGLKNAAPMMMHSVVGYNDLASYISVSGFIENGDDEEVIVSANTEIADVHVKIGDQVTEGQLLVSFDHTSADRNYRSAQIAYEKVRLQIMDTSSSYYDAMVDLAEAKADLRELEPYKNDNDIEKAAYLSQEQVVKSLERMIPSDEALQRDQLLLEEAATNLRVVAEDYNNLPQNIYASQDGVVQTVGVKKLSPVAKGTVAVALQYNNSDTVGVAVGKYDLPRIQVGQKATVKVGKAVYEGEVTNIGTVAKEGNVIVKVKVANPDHLFIMGLEGDVDILTYQKDNVLCVPVESVKSDRQGSYVFKLNPAGEDGSTYIPEKLYIEVGNSSDQYTEVLGGIAEGDKIVTAPPTNMEMYQLIKLA